MNLRTALEVSNALFAAHGFQATSSNPDDYIQMLSALSKDSLRKEISTTCGNADAIRLLICGKDQGVLTGMVTTEFSELVEEQVIYFSAMSMKILDGTATEFQRDMLHILNNLDQEAMPGDAGIISMIPRIYQENIKRDQWRVRRDALSEQSDFIMKPGARVSELKLQVEYVKSFKHDNIENWIVQGSHDGNLVKFFLNANDASAELVTYIQPGDSIRIKGQVAKHEMDKFIRARVTHMNQVVIL